MQGIVTGAIAVVATLLGSLTTYLFQRRFADRNEQFARQEWLRRERLAVYSNFAETLMSFRRAQYDRWNRRQESPDGMDPVPIREESYRLRAQAWNAYFKVKLVAEDPVLVALADTAVRTTAEVSDAEDVSDLHHRGHASRSILNQFIDAAGNHIRA